MKAEEIRQSILEFARLLEREFPTDKNIFLLAQSANAALHEIAAQLAEMNERQAAAQIAIEGKAPSPEVIARLIAAAPELLDACELEEQVFEHEFSCPDCNQWENALCERGSAIAEQAQTKRRAAIRRAKGEA